MAGAFEAGAGVFACVRSLLSLRRPVVSCVSVDALSELEQLLRPAGAGLFTVSTGRAAQLELQRALYGVSDAREVTGAWRRALAAVSGARVAILGVPSDCGAGL